MKTDVLARRVYDLSDSLSKRAFEWTDGNSFYPPGIQSLHKIENIHLSATDLSTLFEEPYLNPAFFIHCSAPAAPVYYS